MPARQSLKIGGVCLLLAFLFSGTWWMPALEDTLFALQVSATPRPPLHPDLILVAKDDATWARPPGGRWGRHVFARALRGLGRAGVGLVGLDFVLDSPRPVEDLELVEALADPPPVVMATEEQDARVLVADQGAGLIRHLAASRDAFQSVAGPHPGLAPWVAEGFVNIGRSRQVKAPATYVELYRPGDPPRAGFAFRIFLERLVQRALREAGPAPDPPPEPAAPEAAWRAWLAALPGRPSGDPRRFPDPAMERLLRRAELRARLAACGRGLDQTALDRLEALAPGALLPVRLPGPPPRLRVHRIDFAPPARIRATIPLYEVADEDLLAARLGGASIRLEQAGTLAGAFSEAPLAGPMGSLRGRMDPDLAPRARLLAVHRGSGLLIEAGADPGGGFTLAGLPHGRVDVYLVAPPDAAHPLGVSARLEGLAVPGPELRFPTLRRDAALVVAGAPGDTLRLQSSRLEVAEASLRLVQSATLPAAGELRLEGLCAGEYVALGERPGAPRARPAFVRVAPEAAARVTPPVGAPAPRFGVQVQVPGGADVTVLDLLTGERVPAPQGRTGPEALAFGDHLLWVEAPDGTRRVHQPGRARFRDRVALVGTTLESDQDSYPTPVHFGEEEDMPGVEVHAHALSNLLHGRQLEPLGPLVSMLPAAGLVALTAAAFQALAPLPAVAAAAGLTLLYLALSAWLLVVPGRILSLAPGLVAELAFVTAALALHLRFARRETARVREVFGKCVDPVLRDRLLETPDLVLAGERRLVTVLFSDVRGFTSLSERLPPEEVLAVLNDYFGRVTPVFLAHGGVFDKYIGDAFMGFFGAPLDQPDHPTRAVRAALAMLDEHARWKAGREAAGLPAFEVGFGINTGPAVAGAIGSEASRVNYSVLGDAVNVAARLESLTKEKQARLLVSGETFRALEGIPGEDLGEVPVKGRREPVRVFRLR